MVSPDELFFRTALWLIPATYPRPYLPRISTVACRLQYVSPQDYANCFRLAYNAIKQVRPAAKVLPQALAPFAGPYNAGSTNGYPHDANPLNWVQYLNQMLTAIKSSGELG